jgi:hypothetical protein
MPLSSKHVQDVCLFYNANYKTCRYLRDEKIPGIGMLGMGQVFHCVKKRPKDKSKIDSRVNDFIKECRKKGQDPNMHNVPLGNNCEGYPIFKHIEQGYDKI